VALTEHSLDFLTADLANVAPDTPVVLFTHYGLRGFGSPGTAPWPGYSPDFWWSTREAHAFAYALKGHHVVALIHGHTHACAFYQWDLTNVTGRVVDVYNAPALQKGGSKDPLDTPSQFVAFEIDTSSRRFRAFQRVGSEWGSIQHEKALDAPSLRSVAGSVSGGGQEEQWIAHESAAVGSIHVRAQDARVTPEWVVV